MPKSHISQKFSAINQLNQEIAQLAFSRNKLEQTAATMQASQHSPQVHIRSILSEQYHNCNLSTLEIKDHSNNPKNTTLRLILKKIQKKHPRLTLQQLKTELTPPTIATPISPTSRIYKIHIIDQRITEKESSLKQHTKELLQLFQKALAKKEVRKKKNKTEAHIQEKLDQLKKFLGTSKQQTSPEEFITVISELANLHQLNNVTVRLSETSLTSTTMNLLSAPLSNLCFINFLLGNLITAIILSQQIISKIINRLKQSDETQTTRLTRIDASINTIIAWPTNFSGPLSIYYLIKQTPCYRVHPLIVVALCMIMAKNIIRNIKNPTRCINEFLLLICQISTFIASRETSPTIDSAPTQVMQHSAMDSL